MIYTVPTSKATKYLNGKEYIVTSDEGEAVAMAAGEYLVTGKEATVVLGENGLLNALDSIITLIQLYEIPLELIIFARRDEPQHEMVTKKVQRLLDLYRIESILFLDPKEDDNKRKRRS